MVWLRKQKSLVGELLLYLCVLSLSFVFAATL